MALNFTSQNTDFVQRTAESRRITRALVGDFTFDEFSDHHRSRTFLSRNMTKVLAYHDRNRTRASSRTRGPFLGNSAATNKISAGVEAINGIAEQGNADLNGNDASKPNDSDSARPDIESMSQDCLKVKAQNGSPMDQSAEKRRSIRHRVARQHQDKNAQLYFDIVNIRKKLNFKEYTIEIDERPRKRVRRENVTCHCHITIWDNRRGLEQKESLVRKSVLCEVSTVELGNSGYSADIKLQQPFIFKSSELNIPLNTPQGTSLGIGDQYFLEIKIIPTKDDVDWPPVPVLGRSEGDQTTGLGRMAAEKLQGALVARYLHLPVAPPSDVPLSLFFLHDGRTYRSKYGLEVNAAWSKAGLPEKMIKRENDETQINLWALDEEQQTPSRKDSSRTRSPLRTENGITNTTTSKTQIKPVPKPPPPVKVILNIDAASAKGSKEFRKSTITGLCCPACPKQSFSTLEELHFHFMTLHSKYKFTIEKQEIHPETSELISVIFKIISVGVAKPRNSDREPRKVDKDLNWQAPSEPLDVPSFVSGDQNWVEQNWTEGVSKKPEPPASTIVTVPDKLSSMRQQQHGGFGPAQKGGFLPAEHVTQFRKPERPKFRNVKLRTMTTDKETMYTSVSHRRVWTEEEPRSESDDEMEDSWFIQKSIEVLDLAAEKQGWSEEQRVLRHKWNQARLREKLSHPRYLSDCLIRFVRDEKTYIKGGGTERKETFAEFIDELLQRRVINQEVVRDVWMILHEKETPGASTGMQAQAKIAVQSARKMQELQPSEDMTLRENIAEVMLRHPPYTCAICVKPIEELRHFGVRCSEHDCEAPGVWYHNQCVKCKRKDKLGWKCGLCIDRLTEIQQSKGKGVAMD